MTIKTLLALTAMATAIPLWAIYENHRVISVTAREEDNCASFRGVYALTAVVRDGDHVVCQYR